MEGKNKVILKKKKSLQTTASTKFRAKNATINVNAKKKGHIYTLFASITKNISVAQSRVIETKQLRTDMNISSKLLIPASGLYP